jgi:hypothetical protein
MYLKILYKISVSCIHITWGQTYEVITENLEVVVQLCIKMNTKSNYI